MVGDRAWVDALACYGARREDIVVFGGQTPDHLDYLDIVGKPLSGIPYPAAVVQCQRQPLLYLYSDASLGKGPAHQRNLNEARRMLAMRGDAAMVAVHRPGSLEIVTASLNPLGEDCSPWVVHEADGEAPWLIPRLAQGDAKLAPSRLHIAKTLFDNLDRSARKLAEVGVTPDDALSLTGRAMFLRFLLDRGILPKDRPLPFLPTNAEAGEAFASPQYATDTCLWLDRTFNGDLLPLSQGVDIRYFQSLWTQGPNQVADALSAILALDSVQGDAVQRQLDWGDLHLAHVPVGLLSQVYERHMEIFQPETRKRTSAYYTPRPIAELMVDEAFFALDRNKAHEAKVLDPAAGAGVFLVAAFHKLVEARWRHEGRRPDREILKQILNTQLRGFDINPSALRLAALSLYLTRLELDPDPRPAEALKFDALQNRTLFLWSDKTGGSLGPEVGPEHNEAYDLVIGNPPWTAEGKDDNRQAKQYTEVSRRVAIKRAVEGAERYENPYKNPDLPFIWRAMEWAKAGGRIALAIHARILFQQSDKGTTARNALFQAIHVTGILNGAALRLTDVWPNMDQAYCLLFAENRKPNPEDGYVFVSPVLEPGLNDEGRMRVDAQAAMPVQPSQVERFPWRLKGLFRGGDLACSVVKKLTGSGLPTIKRYWEDNRLVAGNGYQLAGTRQDSEFLYGMPDLRSKYADHPYIVLVHNLPKFLVKRVLYRRQQEIYRGPLVVARKGFRHDRNRGRALLAATDVAFSENFHGFSCAGHCDSEGLAAYLLLVLHSNLYSFFVLMTSGEYGIERDAAQFADVLRFPLAPFDAIEETRRRHLLALAKQLVEGIVPWAAIDTLIYDIYHLSLADRQVIEDTLATAMPEGPAKTRASSHPTNTERQAFRKAVREFLAPFFLVTQRQVDVTLLPVDPASPWSFLEIRATTGNDAPVPIPVIPGEVLARANDLMTSRIIQTFESDPAVVRVGLLNQYRYWTPTQARTLAADIYRNLGYALEQGSAS